MRLAYREPLQARRPRRRAGPPPRRESGLPASSGALERAAPLQVAARFRPERTRLPDVGWHEIAKMVMLMPRTQLRQLTAEPLACGSSSAATPIGRLERKERP